MRLLLVDLLPKYRYPAFELTEKGKALAARLHRDEHHEFYDPENPPPPPFEVERKTYRKRLLRLLELMVEESSLDIDEDLGPNPEEKAIYDEIKLYRDDPKWAEEVNYLSEIQRMAYARGYQSCGGDEAYEAMQ